jgi:hypothetical protein
VADAWGGCRRQPNAESLQRQLQLWSEMVLAYCQHNRIYRLDLTEHLASPLFNNERLHRTGRGAATGWPRVQA